MTGMRSWNSFMWNWSSMSNLMKKGNDVFLSKSTSNIEMAALASVPEHSVGTDARAPVHRQRARNNDAVVGNAYGPVTATSGHRISVIKSRRPIAYAPHAH